MINISLSVEMGGSWKKLCDCMHEVALRKAVVREGYASDADVLLRRLMIRWVVPKGPNQAVQQALLESLNIKDEE